MIASIFSTISCTDECRDEPAPAPGSCVEHHELVCERVDCERRFCVDAVGFDAIGMATIAEAKRDWSASTMDAIVFDVEPCERLTFVMTSCDDPALRKYECPRGIILGDRVLVNGDRVCGSRQIASLARHELGHAFGLKHTDESGTLMYFLYNDGKTPMCVGTRDVNAFLIVNDCCK